MSDATRDEFARYLAGLPPAEEPPPMPIRPVDIEAAAQLYGPGANKRIAEQLGVSTRTVQRWRKAARGEPGETRQPKPAALKRVLTTARRRQLASWRKAVKAAAGALGPLNRVRRDGIDMRMRAWLIVSQPPSHPHTMPASQHGAREHARFQFVAGDQLADAIDAWRAGDRNLAGELIDRAFLDAYGLPDEAGRHTELEHVEWTQIR